MASWGTSQQVEKTTTKSNHHEYDEKLMVTMSNLTVSWSLQDVPGELSKNQIVHKTWVGLAELNKNVKFFKTWLG